MLSEGRYFVWFKTPIGEGASEVELLSNGNLTGSDTNFSYTGRWTQVAGRFKVDIHAKRFAPGPPGVFGLDEIDIVVTGHSSSEEVLSGSGFAKQAPALKLSITFSRMDSR
ncbi:hypothetical protein ACWX0K_13380 [Nitrobacteraceae bacterium UC4446_H13]